MNRMAARLLIVFAIGGAPLRSLASGEAPCAGPQFRGGGAHEAVYCSDPIRHLGGVRWRFATEGPVRSSPVVSEGVVFVGSGDHRLYAVDARSGKETWRRDAGAPVDATPAIAGARVFAATARRVFAVDRATGAELWSRSFGNDLPLPGGFGYGFEARLSSPSVDGDAVLVGGGDGVLYRIDAATGKTVWRFRTRGRIRATPAAAGGVVYVGSFDGVFYAVDEASGKLRWKYETEGASLDLAKAGFDRRAIDSSAALSNGIVTFGSRDAHQYALDARTGALRWRFGHPAAIVPDHAEVAWCEGSPAVADGTTYVGSSDGHFVNALDLVTGKERWRHETPSRVNSSPAVVGDIIVAGGEEGSIFALSRGDGRLLWSYAVNEAVRSSPAVADGTVYAGADDGALYALAGAAPGATFLPWKAVYLDEKLSGWFQGGSVLAEYLRGCGFQRLDAASLPGFLAARSEDRVPSVVVFASDEPPAAITESAPGAPPAIERYLRSGGQAVWVGFHPFALVFDESTGARKGLDFPRARRLIGVGPEAPDIVLIEEEAALPTAEGREWGLPPTSIASSPVDAKNVTTVLAHDPFGRANAWVKSVGDGRLVRFWGRRDAIRDLEIVRRIAEHAVEKESER